MIMDTPESYHDNLNKTVSTEICETGAETAVYKRRWLMLAVVVILNVSNGALWISFATIANSTATYFEVNTSEVDWFSLVFFVSTIPMMFVALWVTDRFGFRSSALSGSFLNALGSVIRLIGTLPIAVIPKQYQYPIAMVGQTISSLAQPFVMCLPTKVSEVWFPENQRTFSTAIAAMANPFGFMVASIISPAVVTNPSQVPTANYILSGFGIASGLFGFSVWQSKPPKPPSIGALKAEQMHRENAQSYLIHLQKIVKNKDFMILTLAIGGGMGLVSAMQTMMAQVLCPWGYGDDVAGLCCATMVLGGFIGAAVFSIIAEKTKRLEEIIKYGFTGAVLLTIVFTLLSRTRNIAWLLATLIGIMGFLAMGVYPVCLEAGVETTYPLDESFSSGMIVVVGQVQGVIFIPVMEALVQPLGYKDRQYEVCQSDQADTDLDMTYSGLFLVGFAAILNCLLIIFFKPKYKRIEAEKEKLKQIASDQSIHST